MITMSARTADSALRARRPRAVGHGYFMIQRTKSVDTFYTSVKTGSEFSIGAPTGRLLGHLATARTLLK